MKWTFSNSLSLIRGFFAFLFLFDDVFYRTIAILMAMTTDVLDGYLARRFNQVTQLGAFLDPFTDKFFVFFAMAVFCYEGQLNLWKSLSLLSRDFAVLLFGGYLVMRGKWSHFQFRSIWSGKMSTTVQFFVLFCCTFRIAISPYVFICLATLGVFAFFELYSTQNKTSIFSKVNQEN